MPADNPGKVSREMNADILTYILSVNQFPAGSTELPKGTEFLKQIRIDAAKPEENAKPEKK